MKCPTCGKEYTDEDVERDEAPPFIAIDGVSYKRGDTVPEALKRRIEEKMGLAPEPPA